MASDHRKRLYVFEAHGLALIAVALFCWVPCSRAEELLDGSRAASEVPAADACRDLRVGETRNQLVGDEMISPTDIPRNFSVTRLPDEAGKEVYKLKFSLNFLPGPTYEGPMKEELQRLFKTHEEFPWLIRYFPRSLGGCKNCDELVRVLREIDRHKRASINECLRRLNDSGLLHDPSGRKFKIEINEELETNRRGRDLPNVDVGAPISPEIARERSNMTAFATDASCSTYVHELMHHTGLVDEYKEVLMRAQDAPDPQRSGFDRPVNLLFKFNCRVIGPDHSIMSNHTVLDAVLDTAAGRPILFLPYSRVLFCSCEGGKCPENGQYRDLSQVMNAIRSGQLRGCPPGTSLRKTSDDVPSISLPKDDFDFLYRKGEIAMPDPSSFRPSLAPILPAHSTMLRKPGCEGENRTYVACAKAAYETSRECRPLPQECRDSAKWLGAK